MLRPSQAISFDDSEEPKKFDALVVAAGAISPKYNSRMLCCGESYSRGDDTELAPTLIRGKFQDFIKENIDAVSVACPACFLQFDTQQMLMQRKGEEFHFPVLYVTEMLCLALGVDLKMLGLDMHRVSFDRFFSTSRERKQVWEKMKSAFDTDSLRRCYACGDCENDCPSALNTAQFKPNELIGKVVRGEIEEVVASPEIWKCLECHTCLDLCPQRFGMEKVFSVLKDMAVEKKLAPSTVKAMMETFISTSRLGEPQKTLRKKLNLPEAKESGVENWKNLMEAIKD
jgi:heterodisulfide reductase subunit C